jgi:nucleoside-diphosphate-sugar epimerase
MNVVHVDDLASGHVAALERGGRGRSYILGGENLSMLAILQALADCTGLPVPRLYVPLSLILAAGARGHHGIPALVRRQRLRGRPPARRHPMAGLGAAMREPAASGRM